MNYLRKFIDFYIISSIHVALAVFSLLKINFIFLNIKNDNDVSCFSFFGALVGYNFVKYLYTVSNTKLKMTKNLIRISLLTFISFIAAIYYFVRLENGAKVLSIIIFILTIFYTIPFISPKKNVRNWAGVKIYIVTLCWVGVTVFLPIINNNLQFSNYFFLVALQSFILIFVLILIFEIIDLKLDDINLKTVPQQLGIYKTKILGTFLMIVYVLLEFLAVDFRSEFLLIKILLATTTVIFLLNANEECSRYYTSFWGESIPIFCWIIVLLVWQ